MAFELALVASRRAHRNIHSCSRSALLCSPLKRHLYRLGLPQNKQRASTAPRAISGKRDPYDIVATVLSRGAWIDLAIKRLRSV